MGLHKNYSTAVSPVKVAPPLKIKRYLRAAENYYRYKVLEAKMTKLRRKWERKVKYYLRQGVGGGDVDVSGLV